MSETTLKNGERPTDEDTASLLRELASIADSCGDHTLRNRALLYSRALAATPPTPDLDAVVARVRENLCEMTLRCDWGDHTIEPSDVRALLAAAVSRPAEARGVPKVTDAMVDAVLDAMWEKPFTSADNAAAKIRWVLETALAAQREQTP